jgi:protoporphyrinogen/coproporphyrinogen III oxidase
MPGPGQNVFRVLWRLITDPMFQGIFTGLAVDSDKPRRPSDLEDESVGSFLQRRLGNTHVGDNLVSAILHGIYAGDIYQLSVKSLLPVAWHIEGQYGSLFAGMKRFLFEGLREIKINDLQLIADMHKIELAKDMKLANASVYSFKQGVAALSDGLITALKSNPKVRLKNGVTVKTVVFDGETNTVKVGTEIHFAIYPLTPRRYQRLLTSHQRPTIESSPQYPAAASLNSPARAQSSHPYPKLLP